METAHNEESDMCLLIERGIVYLEAPTHNFEEGGAASKIVCDRKIGIKKYEHCEPFHP